MARSQLILVTLAGAVFGAGLALSGMTDPARVRGFLDVTGFWDATLAFVMMGALAVYALGLITLRRRRRGMGWFGATLPCADRGPISLRLVVGAALFGIGWAIGGFCPGPAVANLGALRLDAVIFVSSMALGMLIARRAFGADPD